jgi:hypothetical protein
VRVLRWIGIVLLTLVGGVCALGAVLVTVRGNDGAAAATPTSAVDQNTGWETTPVTKLFPGTMTGVNAVGKMPSVVWHRVGVAVPASCQTALSSPITGCSTVLRATYVDEARSMVATVAIIVLPPAADQTGPDSPAGQLQTSLYSAALDQGTQGGDGTQFPVNVTPVAGTAAAHWSNADLIGLGAATMENEPDWMALVVETGSLDGRHTGDLPDPWATQPGGDARDLDSWHVPAQDLASAFSYYINFG